MRLLERTQASSDSPSASKERSLQKKKAVDFPLLSHSLNMAFLLQPSQLKWNPDDSSHATYPGYVSIAPRSVAVFFFNSNPS